MLPAKPLFFSLLLIPSLSLADAADFRYLEASYITQDIAIDVGGSEEDFDFDGYGIAGKFQFYENFYVSASYSDVSLDDNIPGLDIDQDIFSVGLGYIFGLNEYGSFFGEIAYVDASASASYGGLSEDADENGYAVEAGFRMNLTERAQLNFGVVYVDIDVSDETTVYGEFVYEFLPRISGVASYGNNSGDNSIAVGARYSF